MPNPKIIVILGPTATGKSSLAVMLAKKIGGEVVSADSRQVYRDLNLGTGKIAKKEMDGIPHHLLDVSDPKKQFSAAEYKTLAEIAVAGIISRGKVPIICGGTGFYIDALASGIILPEVPENKKLRSNLEKRSLGALVKMLEKLDPARAQTIDKNNKVRLVRAIEIAVALGTVPKLEKKKLPYGKLVIGLDMDDETLKKRIGVRLNERMKAGMLREAKHLHAKGLSWKRMQALGLEYRWMANLLTKKVDRKEFEAGIAMDIWHYAKRQRTWFRRDKSILWLDPTKKSSLATAIREAKKFLS